MMLQTHMKKKYEEELENLTKTKNQESTSPSSFV